MAKCLHCGADLPDGAKNCPACGAQVNDLSVKAQQKAAQLNNTADTTAEFDPQDIADNKLMAILAYVWILFLVPLFAAPQSKFARYHANQGLLLFIVSIICGIIPILGWLLEIATFILMIIGILNAANGKAKELPIIGKIRLLK